MKKKFFSILLALAMVLCMIPSTTMETRAAGTIETQPVDTVTDCGPNATGVTYRANLLNATYSWQMKVEGQWVDVSQLVELSIVEATGYDTKTLVITKGIDSQKVRCVAKSGKVSQTSNEVTLTLNHDYSTYEKIIGNTDNHKKICADCGTTILEEHVGKWVSTKEPDGATAGTKRFTCDKCAYTYNESYTLGDKIPIVLDYNYGDVKAVSRNVTLNSNQLFTAPQRNGYTFKGWALSPDEKEPYYEADEKILVTSYMELYALWEVRDVAIDITVPSAGKTPDFAAVIPEGADYYVETDAAVLDIMWQKTYGAALDADDTFESGADYILTVVLRANEGHMFPEDLKTMTATVNGKDVSVIQSVVNGYGKRLRVQYLFEDVKTAVEGVEISYSGYGVGEFASEAVVSGEIEGASIKQYGFGDLAGNIITDGVFGAENHLLVVVIEPEDGYDVSNMDGSDCVVKDATYMVGSYDAETNTWTGVYMLPALEGIDVDKIGFVCDGYEIGGTFGNIKVSKDTKGVNLVDSYVCAMDGSKLSAGTFQGNKDYYISVTYEIVDGCTSLIDDVSDLTMGDATLHDFSLDTENEYYTVVFKMPVLKQILYSDLIGTISGVEDTDVVTVALWETDADAATVTATVTGNGQFTFEDVKEGTYILKATADGYEEYKEACMFVGVDATVTIEMEKTRIPVTSLQFEINGYKYNRYVDAVTVAKDSDKVTFLNPGFVVLKDVDNWIHAEDTFAADTDYWICITVEPTAGYSVKDMDADDIVINGVTPVAVEVEYDDYYDMLDIIVQLPQLRETVIHTVTFCFGDTAVGWQEIDSGQCAEKPEDPAQENKVFLGWFTEQGELYDFTKPVTGDISLYARFKDVTADSEGVTRVYGANRYKTSLAIADELKNKLGVSQFDTVIIASGTNFPDALAGSYLAAKKDAPILMVRDNAGDITLIQNYITDNLKSGGKVYILGGSAAVPESIEKSLSDAGYDVDRLKGKGRYDTNLAILNEAGVSNEALLVCTGTNFADSLSGSATGLPMLLVNPTTNKLTAEQIDFLDDQKRQIYIVGGSGAVSDAYLTALQTYDSDGTVERVKGASRYETSVAVANKFIGSPSKAVIASATNFPDGLCGGPLAYTMNAPLILTGSKSTPAADYMKANDITSGIALGGTGALSDDVVRNVYAMKASDEIKNQKYN